MSESSLQLFWPAPVGPYQTDLEQLIKHFESTTHSINCVEYIIKNFPSYPSKKDDELRFRAYLYVLRDLLRQGWRSSVRQGQLYLQPPAWAETANNPELIEQHRASAECVKNGETKNNEKNTLERYAEKRCN